MQRLTPTYCLLVLLTAAVAIGWAGEKRPTGDTHTIIRGDITYADHGGVIHAFRENKGSFSLIASFATQPRATHDDHHYHRPHKHGGTFSCSYTHVHSYSDHHHGHHDDPYHSPAQFVVTDAALVYVYDGVTVVTVDISNPGQPAEASRIEVDWEIDTVTVVDGVVEISGGGNSRRFEAIDNG